MGLDGASDGVAKKGIVNKKETKSTLGLEKKHRVVSLKQLRSCWDTVYY
jgi:hypothetical protein